MKEKELKFSREIDELLVTIDASDVVLITTGGWTVLIESDKFIQYVDQFGNDKNVQGFNETVRSDDVVLTHNSAKITFSKSEFEQLKEFARGLAG